MDVAYDHIIEESFPDDPPEKSKATKEESRPQTNDFTAEVQDAYQAISNSPWAARLGGFLGTVKKQVNTHTHTSPTLSSALAPMNSYNMRQTLG